jgi:hypothetical protein
MICPAQGSREATPSSDKEAPSDVAAHYAQDGIKGSNKRRKKCLQGTTTSRDNGHDWEAGGFGVRHISTTTRSDNHPVRSPTDHFNRLLEEACPNHTYPIRHKFKDCGMMRSFMTSRSLTWGAELDEVPDESDTTLFPEENAVVMVYSGLPSSWRHHMSSLSPRAPICCGRRQGGSGV